MERNPDGSSPQSFLPCPPTISSSLPKLSPTGSTTRAVFGPYLLQVLVIQDEAFHGTSQDASLLSSDAADGTAQRENGVKS